MIRNAYTALLCLGLLALAAAAHGMDIKVDASIEPKGEEVLVSDGSVLREEFTRDALNTEIWEEVTLEDAGDEELPNLVIAGGTMTITCSLRDIRSIKSRGNLDYGVLTQPACEIRFRIGKGHLADPTYSRDTALLIGYTPLPEFEPRFALTLYDGAAPDTFDLVWDTMIWPRSSPVVVADELSRNTWYTAMAHFNGTNYDIYLAGMRKATRPPLTPGLAPRLMTGDNSGAISAEPLEVDYIRVGELVAASAVSPEVPATAAEVRPETGSYRSSQWRNALQPKGRPGAEVRLVAGRKTDYSIIIPENAIPQEKKAAGDLRAWLQEMTTAIFPLVQEDPGQEEPQKFISVGRTRLLEQAGLKESSLDLGRDGYAIAQKGENLYLLGGTKRGPINAVYALLEEDLGCRWYVGQTSSIPRVTELAFRPAPRNYVPRLHVRDPYYYDASTAAWSLRNRINGSLSAIPTKWGGSVSHAPGWFVHTFVNILNPAKEFKAHPEYFSEIGGRREPRQLCLTNPEVLKAAISKVLEVLKANPDAEIISVSPFDGGGHCECSRCRAIDEKNRSPAGSLIQFVNQVAEPVEKEHPGVLVSTLAYLDTLDPPAKVRPRENVAIQLCNDLHAWRWPLADFVSSERPKSKRYRDAVIGWSKVCSNIHIWDYFANFSHYPLPTPNMHVLEPSVRFYLEHNVKGIMFQGSYNGPGGDRAPMRSWVMAKLLWDPSLDVRELERDFAHGYYGEAGPIIAEYYGFLDQVGREHQDSVIEEMGGIRFGADAPFLTREFVTRADELLRRAESLATRAEVRRRVQLEKIPILYVKLERGLAVTAEDHAELIKQFEEITTREGIKCLMEGPPNIKENLKYWRANAWRSQPPAAAR